MKLLIIILALVLQGCKSNETGNREQPAVPVVAVLPKVEDITVYLESMGTLEPSVHIEIFPQVEGTLKEVLVTQGEWVEKGTPLFKIDEKPFAIKVEEIDAQLASDAASLQAAEKKYARFKPLFEKDLLSQTERDNLEAEVEKLNASYRLVEARLKGALLDLEHCTICSPTNGRVGKIDLHPGVLIARGQSLATVSQLDPLHVEFNLTEKEFPQVPNELALFEIKALCTADCRKGMITFHDNHFDSATGLILMRGKIPNEDDALFPGQSVQIKIPVAVNANAMVIPQKAIRYNQEGPYLYVIQPDQTVVIRQVLLGEEQGDHQIVKQGLDPTEKVVIDGHLRLSPGIKVEVKP